MEKEGKRMTQGVKMCIIQRNLQYSASMHISLYYMHALCLHLCLAIYPSLPGKLKRLSLWPLGDGLGGGVALGGLLCWKGAGEEGVDEVVEDGLLLESSWFSTGGWSWWSTGRYKQHYLGLMDNYIILHLRLLQLLGSFYTSKKMTRIIIIQIIYANGSKWVLWQLWPYFSLSATETALLYVWHLGGTCIGDIKVLY